ncbi:hypothetical protein SODALDRAFT_374368 [Sodiomyces alkalinus F11]|uniref:Uncharacterized protein n=1 Tax=Sodiomyces alkalinus (strain CBS 110278 / VKM F-3762 / F11) TaxID=1314773 RepID=A0A3N2Q5L5_SODAK|nr:hypothetical protein SODALDRAFT_374368 [Sodiomyces alkalinus F11]ROT41986.1 hypothetical protein SODALDRAFT_374368 [Sodiomyces alkalinus F11]
MSPDRGGRGRPQMDPGGSVFRLCQFLIYGLLVGLLSSVLQGGYWMGHTIFNTTREIEVEEWERQKRQAELTNQEFVYRRTYWTSFLRAIAIGGEHNEARHRPAETADSGVERQAEAKEQHDGKD